jgi:hypothetical protein
VIFIKPGPVFPTPYVVIFLLSFANIGGIVDHHCLNFLFIISNLVTTTRF